MNQNIQQYVGQINDRISGIHYNGGPKELYEPIRYILDLGGKRLRPLLVLLAYRLFKEDYEKVIDPALAVEIFHNFTLMHDDIMDFAPLRRGQETVHKKWNYNQAILSGDAMLIQSFGYLSKVAPKQMQNVMSKFIRCASEVCEGQELDMQFEARKDVSVEEYLEMIKLKTAVLLGFSLEFGAILADQPVNICEEIRSFGINMGIGFQLKDDLLDVYGDQEKFGKQKGGDIIANKKTFLLIEALEKASEEQKAELNRWINAENFDEDEKVHAVTKIYDDLNIEGLTHDKMNDFFDKAFESLDRIPVDAKHKRDMRQFAEYLMARES